MQVTKTAKSPTEVALKVSADAADLEPIRQHVLRHFINRVKVPGFRSGKAPLNLVEKNVDQRALMDEFMEHAINDLYGKALDQESVRAISRPNVQIKKFVPYTELEFDVEVETIGQITLPDYKKMKFPKPTVSVTAKDVNEVVESLKVRVAERKEVSRAAKEGDEIIIDFSARDDKDQPIDGAEGKDYPLILGSKRFIPGFEDNLLSLKAGEDKEFKLTFPGDYSVPALQNKEATFSVEVKKVSKLEQVKADDKLAAKAGPFKSLAELKADIKKQLTAERQQQVGREYENELIRNITEKSQVDVPPSLVEDQITQMEEDEKRNLVYRGETWQEHLKAEGVNEEQHRERQRPTAAERVKAGLVLSEISSQEGLDVTQEELDSRIAELKSQYKDPKMQTELDKPENRKDIAARMLTEKTISKLAGYASQ